MLYHPAEYGMPIGNDSPDMLLKPQLDRSEQSLDLLDGILDRSVGARVVRHWSLLCHLLKALDPEPAKGIYEQPHDGALIVCL